MSEDLRGSMRALMTLTLLHALIDAYASAVQPLWPDFGERFASMPGAVTGAYILWTLATSASQVVFGLMGDRLGGRKVLWLGPLAGVIGVAGIGWANSYAMLCACLLVGGLGIASFHPEAAALAGGSLPHDRSRALSVFAVGGYLGQAVGPFASGLATARWGLGSLAWGLPVGLLLMGGVALAWPRQVDAHGLDPAPLPDSKLLRALAPRLAVLVFVGTLRVIPAMGLPLAIAYSWKARGFSNDVIGLSQSVFLAGIGAGSLACAMLIRRRHERRVLWVAPVLVAPAILACGLEQRSTAVAAVGLVGFLLGLTMPVLISYGQQMLPEASRVANSLTMGLTWSIGGAIVAVLIGWLDRSGQIGRAFPVLAVSALVGAASISLLPRPSTAPRIVAK